MDRLKPTLHITDLRKKFRTGVLRGINLTVKAGSVVAILGENGSGKTTLLTCLLGLQNYSGSVEFFGGEGTALPTEESAFGILDQFLLYQRWTTRANINYFLNDSEAFDNQVIASLVPQSWGPVKTGNLSTGQVKLVMLGITFASSAPVIVLDEFVNGLDENARQAVKQRILYTQEEERRIIIATGHDLEILEEVATHTYILQHGQLINVTPKIRQGRNMKEVYREHLA